MCPNSWAMCPRPLRHTRQLLGPYAPTFKPSAPNFKAPRANFQGPHASTQAFRFPIQALWANCRSSPRNRPILATFMIRVFVPPFVVGPPTSARHPVILSPCPPSSLLQRPVLPQPRAVSEPQPGLTLQASLITLPHLAPHCSTLPRPIKVSRPQLGLTLHASLLTPPYLALHPWSFLVPVPRQ
jgi:hypothetical protein